MYLDIWLNNPVTSDPTTLNALLNGSFEPEYNSWTMDHVYDVLREMDRQNGSWTDEDPGRGALPTVFLARAAISATGIREADKLEAPPVLDMSISEKGQAPETGKFIYKTLLSKDSCIIEQDGHMWKLTAVEWDEKNVELATTRFHLEPVELKMPVTNGKIKVSFVASSASKFVAKQDCMINVLACSTR